MLRKITLNFKILINKSINIILDAKVIQINQKIFFYKLKNYIQYEKCWMIKYYLNKYIHYTLNRIEVFLRLTIIPIILVIGIKNFKK